MKSLTNFLFEASALKRLKRTGWQILGDNDESIAEHSYMVGVISYIIGKQKNADIEKVLLMALFHDFTESRIGDIYKLADFYVKADVLKAARDAYEGLPDGDGLVKITREYEDEDTLEAKIVHDADTLALCIELKQLIEKGNTNAKEWFEANLDALVLAESKSLGKELAKTNSQDWWKKERKEIHQRFKSKK
ncbi:hypothetical protein A2960_05025 [Candidatus Gottesmanbacteria bacterium RIFCSPLOWO2_01_FULL_39_12b]|uniref:5'-deoxynucleotidase n=1 Tax=Candidatus Gottesmanbacteria bacterium RIFCSPLOWO2_01_FULL_39_12b TaxID=1798388 RepID=A0A1F6AMG0_9BACT|nr:MAG: hypothetical protein A2960_05025 [Candidatus Gottesmanbacteria bacterium RIFCSPLOWO2_01_FULL_39_12b]HLD41707.1 HD domain-containing protein [archaeon]